MSNVFRAKSLGNGQVATSQGAIVTATADVATYVKNLSLFNTNAAAQTVQVWRKKSGGTARKWKRFILAQNEHADLIDGGDAVLLQSGDTIEASTTTTTSVDYFADGVEESTT